MNPLIDTNHLTPKVRRMAKMPTNQNKGNSMKFINSKHLLAGAAALTIAATLSAPSAAQDGSDLLQSKRANIHKGDNLSAAADRASIARFIANRNGNTSIELVLDSSSKGRNGRTHLRMHQEIGGLRVYGSDVKAAARNGRVEHIVERTARGNGKILRSAIKSDVAIEAATAHNFGAGRPADFFHKAPNAEKVIIAKNSGALEEGYLVENWSQADNQLFHTLVDGRGRIVNNENRTANDSYFVFADHPGVSAQTVENGPGVGNAESPVGWLSGSNTSLDIAGNNVHAYLDRDANNSPDGGGSARTTDFLTSFAPGNSPTTNQNQEVAVQNLFYLNNLIHDDLYAHGFNEGARNFQEDNFGKGGVGGDSVNAEAQDGSGTNNANFSTPSDGGNGRMQMYLWTTPDRDGDLDSDIVWHEYGHGLTWRMIGSMSGSVSGAIGEGMGDVLAILHNNQDTVGEYSTDNPNGIRSAPYTNYPRTIADFTNSGVHFDGEIYAATLWHLGELANAVGMDNEAVLDVVIDGMNFTPAGPDYLEMRDGILAASTGDETCLVWQAFADFGMGEGSSFNIRTGGNPRTRVQISESYTVPASCDGTPPPPPPGDFSVSSLTGTSSNSGRKRWSATATTGVQDDTGAAASGVTVSYSWSTGSSGSCTTDSSGTCSGNLGGLRSNQVSSVTFTVDSLNGTSVTGSSIVINRP